MKCPLFWSLYRWVWWKIPGNSKRWRGMLLEALRTNTFSQRLKAISDREWIERIEKEGR